MIPTSFFPAFPSLIKSFNANIEPTIAFSSGLFSSITSTNKSTKSKDQDLFEGIDAETQAMKPALEKILGDYVFKENLQGVSDEALLCLKKGFSGVSHPWGLFEDFDEGVRMVVQQECRLTVERGSESRQRLKVNVYLAESDMMTGKQGGKWFDDCWRPEVLEERVDYESGTVPGTNHETIGNMEFGIVYRICAEVADSFP